MQLDDSPRASRLMQAVDILGDDPGQQPAALEFRDRVMARVRGSADHVPPPVMTARPVPAAGRGAAGERLVRHGLGPPRHPGGPSVVRYAGLGRQPGPAQDQHAAVRYKINKVSGRTGVPGLGERAASVIKRVYHSYMLPQGRDCAGREA